MSTSWGNWPNILGELARNPGGTGSPVLGEPVARYTMTDSSSIASKNPKSKAWLGKNMFLFDFFNPNMCNKIAKNWSWAGFDRLKVTGLKF